VTEGSKVDHGRFSDRLGPVGIGRGDREDWRCEIRIRLLSENDESLRKGEHEFGTGRQLLDWLLETL
jgi:hypothetical protein